MTLQVPLVRWTTRFAGPLVQVSGAMLLMGLGFVGYAVAGNFLGLALATGLVAVGQLLISPVQSTVTARLGGGKGGAYFRVGSLALAVGGAPGNGSRGALIAIRSRAGLGLLPWILMSVCAGVCATTFSALPSRPSLRSPRL